MYFSSALRLIKRFDPTHSTSCLSSLSVISLSLCVPILEYAHSSGVVVVCSSHDFQKTPDKNELVSRMVKMQQVGADLPKVAVMPHDSTDVLTLLSATIEMKNKYFVTPVITISMGKLGVASRLCGEVFGSAMTFASAGDSSAPGQISIDVVNAVLDSITE